MRKFDIKSLAMGFIIGTVGVATVFAASNIKLANYSNAKVSVDGVNIPLNNPLVKIVKEDQEDMKLYVPIRELFEYLGYNVNWDGTSNTVNLVSNSASFTQLGKETEQFLRGEWEVKTFLGFQAITRDDIEWPNGEKIEGKSVVITEQLFSSKDLGEKYEKYATKVINPQYELLETLTGDEFYSEYRIAKALSKIHSGDIVQAIRAESSDKDNHTYGLNMFVVNNNRLIIMLNCDFFELEKILK